ncbi:MAG: DUF2185 domain-containing protein [Planctomycetaceae bacterium]|jgi:hypothetical protein|nr:DUF2185 domain-containing protein [Planctomycetaceae bacterium]
MTDERKFRFTDDQIKPLALGHGICCASDMITVDGLKVGFLCRMEPEFEGDSGWRFLAGYETDEYLANRDNFTSFDVNWIVNCDPQILPYLNKPVGSAYGRDPTKRKIFMKIDY